MFEFKPEGGRIPVKVWLENAEQVEDDCLQQAVNLTKLPFTLRHVALMPDTHLGFGMPIGGVIAARDAIIPNAVGVDIGCGMCFTHTDVPVELLKSCETREGKLITAITMDILRKIPTGFNRHKRPQTCKTLDTLGEINTGAKSLLKEIDEAYFQVGTLGGGNHFIEIQEDEHGKAAIMLHSGSRNFGLKICRHFNDLAKKLNHKWVKKVGCVSQLAAFPTDSDEGRDYIWWMELALNFARENRAKMMQVVKSIFLEMVSKYGKLKDIFIAPELNCHHNYASREEHFGEKVWIHRKGAIRAGKGEFGIIPGAMGNNSYIIEGLGNPESFLSCSHGAGRKMSRHEAKDSFSVQEVVDDLKKQGVFLATHNKAGVIDECRFAYKDIDAVIQNQLDLIKPVRKLKTVGVIKASD